MEFEIRGDKRKPEPVSAWLEKSGDRLDLVFEQGIERIHAICIEADGTITLNKGCREALAGMGFQIDPKGHILIKRLV